MRTPLPACSAVVRCAGAAHSLSWQGGTLTALDHPDADRERALSALGGEEYRCLQLLDVWEQHDDDLDVLLLASRGTGDRIERGREDEHHGGHHHHRGGWYSYNQVGMQSYAPLSATGPNGAQPATLEDLVRLEGRLTDRLAAQVIDRWAGLIEIGDGKVDAARPRLHAALYGRVTAAVRDWRGEPTLRVDLTMTGPAAPRIVRRVDSDSARLVMALPFTWLSEVWSPGLTVVADRLVLAAGFPRPGLIELVTLDRDLVQHRTTLDDETDVMSS